MIPVICHGCGQRGKVASIPDDIACVACRSTDIDLDDRTAASKSNECPKCGAATDPVQDADGKTLRASCDSCGWSGFKRKAAQENPEGYYLIEDGKAADGPFETVTEGKQAHPNGTIRFLQRGEDHSDLQTYDDDYTASRRQAGMFGPDENMGLLPNDQPEMALLGEPKVSEGVRCSVCFHEFTHTPVDPAQRLPACPNCGNDVTTAAGTMDIITARRRYFSALREASKKTAAECPECNGSGAIPAQGGEDPEDIDNGQVQCPKCKGEGDVAKEAKVRQIEAAVLRSNPGMDPRTARRVAVQTVRRYPKVASGR